MIFISNISSGKETFRRISNFGLKLMSQEERKKTINFTEKTSVKC